MDHKGNYFVNYECLMSLRSVLLWQKTAFVLATKDHRPSPSHGWQARNSKEGKLCAPCTTVSQNPRGLRGNRKPQRNPFSADYTDKPASIRVIRAIRGDSFANHLVAAPPR
jgi:hypothetical protein